MKASDGRVYYQNNKTKKTQWTKPEPLKPLPSGWRRGYTKDGREYFLNDSTQKTQWDFPTEPAEIQAPPPYAPSNIENNNNQGIGYETNAPPMAYAYGGGDQQPGGEGGEGGAMTQY